MGDINQLQVELDTCKARQVALEEAIAREKAAIDYQKKQIDLNKPTSSASVEQIRLEKKHLSAQEAREITDNSVTPLIHIYSAIKELATEGSNRLIWDTELDDVARNNIIKQLELDGYKVEKNNPAILDIRW